MDKRKVSYSELKAFCECPQKWQYLYQDRIEKRGIERFPQLGTFGHAAMQYHLEGKDWKDGLLAAYEKSISAAGPMLDEELDLYKDCVKTINEVFPTYLRYVDYSDYKCIKAELPFEVRIPDTDIYLFGYIDGLLKDKDGNHWIKETKFISRSMRDEDNLWLETQIGIYQWAINQVLGVPIFGTIYEQIRAKPFKKPEITKSGAVSKVKIYCDWWSYSRAIIENGLKISDYYDMRDKLSDVEPVRQTFIYRPQSEINNFAYNATQMAKTLAAHEHIYMHTSQLNCLLCPYKNLCLGKIKNHDLKDVIEMEYQPRKRREDLIEVAEEAIV